MASHFGVSRTVLREAIALLQADGILVTRKGSGTFVCAQDGAKTGERGDALTEQSVQSLLNLIEVRLTPKWLAIACSDGKRGPPARPSLWICWRSLAATRAPRVPVVKLPAAGSGGGRVKRNVRSIGASLC